MKGSSKIHMIWTDTPCWSTCWNGGNRMQEALRDPSIEFYLVEHPWMENDTMFGDIILPISTKFEEHDIATSTQCGENDMVVLEEKAVEEVGEAKSDAEAVLAIAEKLGLADELWEHWVYPPMAAAQNTESAGTDEDDFVNQMEMSTEHVFGEPGFDSLQLRSYTLGGCQEHMPYDEFLQKGYLPIRFMDEDKWKAEPIGMRAFYEDPENNPLATPNNLICPNATTSKNAPGEVTNGFLVNIEKVDVLKLAEKYPEQFNRDYDAASGMVASARIVKA